MLIKIFILSFILISYIFLFLTKNQPFLYLSNFIVPDGQTYFFYINEINNGLPLLEIGPEQFFGLPNSFLLWISYLISYQFMGSFGVLLFNIALLIGLFKIINPICILLIPYLLISMILPSKDFLIFSITSLLIYNIYGKNWFFCIFLAFISFLVRDGAGLINAVIILACYIFNSYKISKKLIFINTFLAGIISSLIIEFIMGNYFVFARNKEVSDIYTNENLPSYGSITGYISRVFANITNLAFRQPIFDIDYNLSILGLFYFISGFFSVLTFIYFIKKVLSNNRDSYKNNVLFIVYFTSLFSISLNPLVSARYLLPIIAAIIGNLFYKSKSEMGNYLRSIPIVIILCVITISTYLILGIYPPLNEIGNEIGPEFFWK